jgi:DNA recombination protein RmuC
VDAYNETVASIETRLLVTARGMHGMGVGKDDAPELPTISETTRAISSPELLSERAPASGAD